MDIEEIRNFIDRYEAGLVDAADFVDNCNEIIDVFKRYIDLYAATHS